MTISKERIGDAESAQPFRYGPVARSRTVWAKRKVLALLVRRDLKVRYADSVLGYLWSILDPLMMGLIYWFVFAAIFQRSMGEEPYILYLLAGMLPFNWFTSSVNGSSMAIKGERLVRSTALPRELWILRLVFSKGAEYLLSLPVLVVFAAAYRKGVSWEIFYMIPALAIQVVLLAGLGLLLSVLGGLVRDVDRVVRILMRFLFYASPILYGLNDVLDSPLVPGWMKDIYTYNPITGIVSLYRAGFFGGELYLNMVLASVLGSVVALVIGWWVFIRLEPTLLKEL